MQLNNFGKNISFEPKFIYAPESEHEVLELLSRHRGQKIRVVGRLHSWSRAIVGDGVVLDLRKLNEVRVEQRGGHLWAIIGAGAQLKHVIRVLESQHGLTLPSLGLITEQTIAGASATGTHGSGKHSLSHYIDEVRLAHYDPSTGEPVIRCINEGDELRAARCSLGCLGVVLSVAICCRPQYRLEQHFRLTNKLSQVIESEVDYPQQQFYLLPYRWDYLIQHRKETQGRISWLTTVHRIYWYLIIDVALHVVLIALRCWLRSNWLIRPFFKYVVPIAVVRGWKVVDKSQNLLTMEHEMFRHIEVEIFIERQHLPAALDFITQLLRYLDGDQHAIEQSTWDTLTPLGLDSALKASGKYTHHYPICVRKVLSDDCLISMASGSEESYYAISFISYDRPSERAAFFAFADLLLATTSRLWNARPHWGKYCPIGAVHANRLYPRLARFNSICRSLDPKQAFNNDWADSFVAPRCE